MGDLSPWHIAILVVVLVLLFGARRLPGAAKSLGESMHIFKKSVAGLNSDDEQPNAASGGFMPGATSVPPALSPTQQPFSAPQDSQAAQIEELQRQVQQLQQQSVGGNAGQSNQPT
ncbi:MAG TPA: Sec-independent protein translocase subunit TatA [Streptosporangiaceae bacterium]|nr:Sec-independent protein translocase subunit TatA [Streptosporangiaceae bacterium]